MQKLLEIFTSQFLQKQSTLSASQHARKRQLRFLHSPTETCLNGEKNQPMCCATGCVQGSDLSKMMLSSNSLSWPEPVNIKLL